MNNYIGTMEVYRNISKHYGHPYNKTYYYYYGLASAQYLLIIGERGKRMEMAQNNNNINTEEK